MDRSPTTKPVLRTIILSLWILIATAGVVSSSSRDLEQVVGTHSTAVLRTNDSLMELARRAALGYEALQAANPDIDPWVPDQGTVVTLPTRVVLPHGTAIGLTINLAEMRLFHVHQAENRIDIDVYPLGIGREGRDTPTGLFRVTSKKERPVWRVPAGLRDEDPSLPEHVSPGPRNPLGAYWLGLSAPGYGIHGTNRPLGVGRRISYGCIRMYPEHIEELYAQVAIGTPVRIVYQPIKAGWQGDKLFLQVHTDYHNMNGDPFQNALTVISRVSTNANIDYAAVKDAVGRQDGLPVVIGHR